MPTTQASRDRTHNKLSFYIKNNFNHKSQNQVFKDQNYILRNLNAKRATKLSHKTLQNDVYNQSKSRDS